MTTLCQREILNFLWLKWDQYLPTTEINQMFQNLGRLNYEKVVRKPIGHMQPPKENFGTILSQI